MTATETETAPRYAADCPEVLEFLVAWHEDGRCFFELSYLGLDYDACEPKSANGRKKYVALDSGTSGCFLLDKATGEVWTISAYGRPNRRHAPQPLDKLTARFRESCRRQSRPCWWGYREDVLPLAREVFAPHDRTAPSDVDRERVKLLLGLLADRFDDGGHAHKAGLCRAFDVAGEFRGVPGTQLSERLRSLWRELAYNP